MNSTTALLNHRPSATSLAATSKSRTSIVIYARDAGTKKFTGTARIKVKSPNVAKPGTQRTKGNNGTPKSPSSSPLKDKEVLTNLGLAGVLGTALVVCGSLVILNPYAGQEVEQETIKVARLPDITTISNQPAKDKSIPVAVPSLEAPALVTPPPPPPPPPPAVVAPVVAIPEATVKIIAAEKDIAPAITQAAPVMSERVKTEAVAEKESVVTDTDSKKNLIVAGVGGLTLLGVIAFLASGNKSENSETTTAAPSVSPAEQKIEATSSTPVADERPAAKEWIDAWKEKNGSGQRPEAREWIENWRAKNKK